MTWYEAFLWVHVTATVVWVGGSATLQVLSLRVLASNDAERVGGFAGDVEFVGLRIFTPSSLVLFLSSLGLMLNDASPWDWDEPFVSLGLLVWLASFLVGAGFLGPESGRIRKLIAAEGARSPEARRRIARVLWFARVELVLLLVVVFMMTVKLGT